MSASWALAQVPTGCVPASYTLCGAKTSFTLTAGSTYTNVQWYKDGTIIPGATGLDYVATQTGLYSYSALDATTSCSTSLCCPISITACTKACLGDYVWLDSNQNGIQDATESGVASVTAVLYDAVSNTVVSTTVTDGSGRYRFCNLNPGSYYVKFTAPTGMTFTTPNSGSNDGVDSDPGPNGITPVYSLTPGQDEPSVDAGLVPKSTNCVPASYTLCGTKTSFTLTAGSTYTNVQWYKDGVIIPGATGTDYVATVAGLYSYSALETTTGCSTSLCCPISITTCSLVCEKPVLSLLDPTCTSNGFYSISLLSSTSNLVSSAGQLSGSSIINIPIGTPVSVTASHGAGCFQVLTADSPTGCTPAGDNNCTPPKLSVGQPLCQGTTYTVSYRLSGVGRVTSNVGSVNSALRVIENIPVGQNLLVTATGSGTCVTRLTVMSPASCSNVCENPAISLSGPECVSGSASYEVSYVVAAGSSVRTDVGVVANGVISGIPSGIPLNLTVTTANGCSPKVVSVPPASCTVCTALGLNTATTLAQCGQANGIATVVVNAGSGVAPYTYQWTSSTGSVVSSSSLATGLAAGVYTVKVTDSKGCVGQKQVSISSTEAPVIVAQAQPTSCGGANGQASVQVSGGSGSYSYRWTSSAGVVVGSSASVSGLPSGTYLVQVSDGSGCSSTTSVVVGASSPVVVVATVQNAVCGQPTGGIRLQVSGGSGSYSYQWTSSAGVVVATSSELSNALPGSYTVTVRDGSGCVGVASGNISNLSGPQLSGVVTDVKCFGTQTGGVVLRVMGGTPPVGYLWSNGSTSRDLVGVGAGVYTVTARDGSGCVAVQSFTVSQPSELVAVFQPTYPTCGDVAGGRVSLVSISGGSSPYSYTWSTGSTASSLSGLVGGTYTLTIRDGNGCLATSVAVLPSPTNCTAVVCEKPVLTVGNPICNPANGTYSVSLYSSTASVVASAGVVNLSAGMISGIPVGTPVSVTASNGADCYNVSRVDSPLSCSVNPSCSQPRLTVGQPICEGTGYYSVNYTVERGNIQVSAGRIVGNSVLNIPIGTPLQIWATDGSCVTRLTVMSPASCSNVCENPAISLSGPICDDKGTTTYYLNYTVTSGATVRVSQGYANGHWIYGIPSGVPLSLTVIAPGCSDKVVTVPGLVCGQTPQPVFDLALTKKLASGQSASVVAGSNVTFTVTVYNQGNVDATNVQVTDYIPAGLTLNDAAWSAVNGKATLNSLIASLPAGQSVSRNITFVVGEGVTGSIVNTAEISNAGNAQNIPDIDSDPDNDPTNDGTPVNDDTSGDHKHNPSQDEDDSDIEGITVNPVRPACEKPVLTVGNPVCNPANGTYSVSLYSSTASVVASAGVVNLSAGMISGIPVGTPVSVTASNGADCYNVSRVDSPLSCSVNPSCSQPRLTVGQPICEGTGYYSVNYTVERGNIQVSAGRIVGNSVLNIPIGTPLQIWATDGSCVTRLTVMSPASCSNVCENPAISLSGPICDDKGTTTYYLNYTVTSGATVRVSQGYANGHWIYGIPSGVPLSLTVIAPGCSDKVVTVPGLVCGQTPQPLLDLAKQVNKSRAALGEVVTYTLTLTNKGTGPATNVEVQESMSSGLALVPGSVSATVGSYAATSPVGIWTIPSLAAGATATLTFSASVTQVGVVYNKAAIPGDTVNVCTTVPVKVCKGVPILVDLSAPQGYRSYQWYRNGSPIAGATSYTYTASQYGEFTVQVNGGQCPNGACCPIVIEEEAGVTFALNTQAPTCNGSQPLANGMVTIGGLPTANTAYRFAIAQGNSFTTTSPILQAIPANGVLASNLVGGQTYTIRVFNSAGCWQDQTVTIGVANCGCQVEPPVVTCAVTEICKGNSTVLSTRGCESGTVIWSDGRSGATIMATPSVTTTYTASCVIGNCVSKVSNAITVTVLDVKTPTLTASADNVCPGTSVTLTATGCESGTVVWSDKAQVGNSIVVMPYGKTTYTAQCRQSACLSAPALITINVNTDLPTPTVTCSTTVVCPGETVTLTAENCVGTPIWNSTTATTGSIVVTPTLGSNRYWVYCKNGACTSKSSNIYTIQVIAPEVPTLTASADTVCLGGSVVLTATGCNGSVLWSTGETGASITVRPTANTSYYASCKFRTCLSNQSNPVAIAVVNPLAPIVKVSKTMICSGEPVSLTATGCSGTVQWHGVAKVGSVITIYPTESKEYYATCKQGACESSASNTVRITVNTSTATAPTVIASTTTVCNSGVVSLTARGCNGNVTWSTGQTGAVVTVTPTPANREFYALCVPASGTACGSAKSNVVTITVAQPVAPSIVASRTAVCSGETLTLTASGCNGIVKWSNGQIGSSISVSPQTATDYQATCSQGACESTPSTKVTVVVNPSPAAPVVTASSLTVCSGSVVSLTATGCNGTVKWSDGQIGAVVSMTATAASREFYAICNAGTACGSPRSNVVSISLAPTAAPTITASRDAICSGEKVTLTATGCAGNVIWHGISRMGASIDIYPTATSDYYATCSVGTCESLASNKVTVTVNTGTGTIPVVSASTQQVCIRGVVSLTATGCTSGTVVWSDGQMGTVVSVTATDANHEFYALCKEAGQCGTGKSNVVNVTVTTMPTPVAVCSTDSICAGEEVTLTVQNCQGTPHWSTGATTTSIIVRPTVTTGYTVFCTSNGCTSPTSKSYVITVVPVPAPTITTSATAVEPGGTVTLTAKGCPGTVIWSANDIHGNNTGNSIVVRPEGTQTYSAQCKYRTCLSDPSTPVVVNPGTCVVKAGGLTPVSSNVCASNSTTALVAATLSGGLVQPEGYAVAYLLTKDGVVQQMGTAPQFSVPSTAAQYVIHTLVYNSQTGNANYLNLTDIKPGLSRTTDVLQLISGKCAALDATGARVSVRVVSTPVLSTTALTVCSGGPVSVTATGCVGGSVKWSDGKEGAVYETSVYTERWLTAICEVDGCPSAPSASLHITLGNPAVPVIVSTPSICVGETVSLTATGCADGAYLWSDGTTTSAILTVTPNADVTYRVKCKLASCEGDWSASATVRVGKPAAPTISLQGTGSTTVCDGMPVTLVAQGCPTGGQVVWSNNMTGASITLSPVRTETYMAYCTNAAGSCRSDASTGITLTVLPRIAAPTVVDKTNNCPIKTVDLSTGVMSQVTTTGGLFEYYTDAALTSKVANPAAVGSGTYYVIERTANGCMSLPAIIHVQITTCTEPTPCDGVNPATADAGVDANLCSATSYQLRGVLGGGGKTAHWTTSGSGRFDNPYLPNAVYTASAEDVMAGQVTLTLAVSTSNVNCPVATDQMVLTLSGVKAKPTISVVGATQLCYGDSVILKSSEGLIYRWNTGAVTQSIVVKQSGVYSVQVLDDKGCISVKSDEVTVKVADPVMPPLVTNLRNTCPSKIVDLTKALSSTTVGSRYIYRICECVTSNIVIRPDSVCEGTYWIVEKTAQGCVSKPSKVVVKVFDCASDTLRSDVSITKTVNHTVVNGAPVTYTLSVSNAGPHTAYNVDVRDVLPSGLQLLPSAGYTFVNGVITKRIDSLKAGAAAQIVFSARVVKKGETIVNRAEITYQDHVDPNLGNNSSSVAVRDTASIPVSQTGTAGLGLALAVVKVEAQSDNSYNVTYKGTIRNTGSVDLYGLSLADSLNHVFLAPASYSVVSGPIVGAGSTLVANTGFNGSSQSDLLNNASKLAAGAQDTVVFVVNVKTNGNSGPFYSSATVTGTTPDASQTVKDISNNGFDPTPEGSALTTVRFDLPRGLLGVAKEVGTPMLVTNGIYDIPYTITLTNMGSLPLRKVQVSDDLTRTFGSGALIVSNRVAVSSTGTVSVDTLYTGQGLITKMLVDTASTLAVGAKATLRFTVRVDVRNASPQSSSLTFYNTAYGTALASDNQVVADTSMAGANTDPDNDLDPRNNSQSTPVSLNGLTTDAHIGLAMAVADTVRQSDGSYNVTYQIVVKAYGPDPLKNVLITDTLSKVFNSQAGSSFKLVRAPFITSTGSALKLNPNYNGVSDPVIVLGDDTSSLAVGKVDTIRMVINVTTDGSTTTFLNSAYGLAQYRGGTVSDVSTSGLNPDLNGNGDPTDPNEREATPLTMLATYQAVFIPQGFSPNGDGINDLFVIRGTNGLTVSLEVYNRWGNLVYKNDDYKNDWDGKPNSGIVLSSADANGLPDGTYYYVVTLSDGRKFVRYMTINR